MSEPLFLGSLELVGPVELVLDRNASLELGNVTLTEKVVSNIISLRLIFVKAHLILMETSRVVSRGGTLVQSSSHLEVRSFGNYAEGGGTFVLDPTSSVSVQDDAYLGLYLN